MTHPRSLSRPWRLAARAGILALLLQLLLPVHGFAAPDGTRVPVCTGGGIVWKVLPEGPEAPPPATGRAAADCPFCLFHAAALAAPAPVALPLPAARPADVRLPAMTPAPVVRHVRAHGSRGPPARA